MQLLSSPNPQIYEEISADALSANSNSLKHRPPAPLPPIDTPTTFKRRVPSTPGRGKFGSADDILMVAMGTQSVDEWADSTVSVWEEPDSSEVPPTANNAELVHSMTRNDSYDESDMILIDSAIYDTAPV